MGVAGKTRGNARVFLGIASGERGKEGGTGRRWARWENDHLGRSGKGCWREERAGGSFSNQREKRLWDGCPTKAGGPPALRQKAHGGGCGEGKLEQRHREEYPGTA